MIEYTVGIPYGHVPGHHYHDVTAKITGKYIVSVTEVWGSAQGRDEEHGRRYVSARSVVLASALAEAERKCEIAGMDMSWVVQAISYVADEIGAIPLTSP